MILKRSLNKIRSATLQLHFRLLLFLIICALPFQLLAQGFDQHTVSNGAGLVSGGNYTGYVSAGQIATYLYSNGTQTATQGIILNQISSQVEFTFKINGTLTENQALKSGTVQVKSAVAINSGPPLAFAKVYLIDAETEEIFAETTTDENGFFEFNNVKYKNFYFTVNSPQIPPNPVLLTFESNIFVNEVIVNGEVGTGGFSATVEIIPVNTCQPGQSCYMVWFRDFDGDGYGNASFYVGQCTQPMGYVLNKKDPDDNDPTITPSKQVIKIAIDQKGVEKCLNMKVCIELKVKPGWNIFSINNLPDSTNLKYIFKPFIDDNTIVKIQDKAGKALENWGIFGGWINDIGKVSVNEGYKIKLSQKDSVIVCGIPVKFPYPIPLNPGWNIMGYPQTKGINGMEVVQQLIKRGTLLKVQDEAGNAIENWGTFGGWQNTIGNFMPGEGYKIKMNEKDTLWVYESYPKSAADFLEETATLHFIPAFEGNGIDHLNINLVGLPANMFKAGDELAIFDGETCVGAITLMPHHLQTQTISIVASAADNHGMPGFNEGNPFVLKLWSSQQNTELILEPEIIKGVSTFTKDESTFASLEKYATTGLNEVSDLILNEINCYPNPFSEEVNIEINLFSDAQVQVEVLNQLGQQIKIVKSKQLLSRGLNKITWDGRNAVNQKVSQGIYFIRINVDGKNIHKKILYQNN